MSRGSRKKVVAQALQEYFERKRLKLEEGSPSGLQRFTGSGFALEHNGDEGRGSCTCRAIRFESEKVVALTHCHRSICRKESGASFATFAHVRRERFKLTGGQDLISPDMNGHPVIRGAFASDTAPAPKYVDATRMRSVPAGLLDGDPGVRPASMSSLYGR